MTAINSLVPKSRTSFLSFAVWSDRKLVHGISLHDRSVLQSLVPSSLNSKFTKCSCLSVFSGPVWTTAVAKVTLSLELTEGSLVPSPHCGEKSGSGLGTRLHQTTCTFIGIVLLNW